MSRSEKSGGLRRRAEGRLGEKPSAATLPETEEDLRRFVHEIQVHQTELDIQNGELCQAKEALEESHTRCADLYDFAPVGYFTLDREGVVLEANLRGASLLKVERSRLAGQRFGLFVATEVRPAFADFLARVFAGRGPETCEVPLVVGVEHPLHVQIEAVFSESRGECRAAVIDISGRKRSEDALQHAQQEERDRAAEVAALLDAVPAAVWIAHDTDAFWISGNRRADELMRLPLKAEASLTSPANRPQNFKVLKDGRELQARELPVQIAARGTEVSNFEEVIRFEDGTERHLLGNAVPLFDGQGRPRGAIAAFVDITDRKRAEESLRRQTEELAATHARASGASKR